MTNRIGEDPIRRRRQRQCFQEEPNSWYAQVSAPLVIVSEIAPKVAEQRALVPHDDVIETLASDGADHAFDE